MTRTIDTIDTIDVENEPVLRDLINLIQKDLEPRALRLDGKIVAIVNPTLNLTRPDLTPAERRSLFMRSAGGWEGLVDTEELKKAIYESRGREYDPDAEE